jgi:NAD(P)-dependent dehydrogenase (short-subunit alcohol dehydrogenase family)
VTDTTSMPTSPAMSPTVVVTGASRGIGAQIAMELAKYGYQVIAVGRDEGLLGSVVASLEGTGHRAVAFDVRDEDGWQKLAAGVQRIDGVVAAAGMYGPIGRIDSVDLQGIRDTFDVNVFGSLLAVRTCLPKLIEAAGSVVLFAGGGSEALPGYDSYLGSKAAVVRLAENLAAELAENGVRVNAVAPGFVATDIHRATLAAGPDQAGSDFYERTVKALAEGGFPATEVAELVRFLLSSDSAQITGRFVSARWDPWRESAWQQAVANSNELLTMRRIDGVLFSKSGA